MKLKEMYIPQPFNMLSDSMMSRLNISHQRFFHHEGRQMPKTDWAPFQAANVGLFTAYDDFKDVALQGLGIIAKPLIYVTAILAYTLLIAAAIIAALFMPVLVHCTKSTYKETAKFLGAVLLVSTTGLILSALSTVTEPVFSALGFFTRFFGSCVNPERHDIPAAKTDDVEASTNPRTLFGKKPVGIPLTGMTGQVDPLITRRAVDTDDDYEDGTVLSV